jgi:hypothetical protein
MDASAIVPIDETVEQVFSYHRPTEDQVPKYEQIRAAAKQLAQVIVNTCPPSADRTAALRKVREAVMTANASVALGGKSF